MDNILEKIEKLILHTTVILVPLVALSVFPNAFFVPKLIVLSYGVGLLLLVKAIRIIYKGSVEFSTNKFDLPVVLFLIAYLISGLMVTPNRMEAFFVPGTAAVVVSSTLLYFFISSLEKKERRNFSATVFFSGVLFAIISLLSFTNALEYIPQLPAFVKDPYFNTLGGQLPGVIFLVSMLPLGIGLFLSQKDIAKKMFIGLATLLLILSLGISVNNILPGKPSEPRLLDYKTSWAVAIDAIKTSPALGVGPGNYLSAFNQFRPLSYNQTDNWGLRFISARSFYLTVLTETGLLGAAAITFLVVGVYWSLKGLSEKGKGSVNLKKSFSLVSLIVLLTSFVFFAAVSSHLVLLFALLAINGQGKRVKLNLSASAVGTRLPAFLFGAPIIAGVIIFAIFSSRAITAEATFKKGLSALLLNDGVAAYEAMGQAINTNPYVDRYHASYSQINLALANSVAQNTEITDQDRDTIAQLIQQAIREAKATVTLNPQRASNWEILARTYQTIAPYAQGADQFAIQTYNQTIALDPINPNYRIAAGGIFFALGNYDSAIEAFKLAVLAKPDYANAHYNLAFAYREKGEIEEAISEMTIVLSLVDLDSNDYLLAKTELDNLEKRRPAEEEGTENLVPPQEAEKPVLAPPLELPEEAEPPVVPTTTPSPKPSPEN